MAEINDLVLTRARHHGNFSDGARVMQGLRNVVRNEKLWGRLTDVHREAIEMTLHKIGRIVVGDPDIKDHWADIQGYCQLVLDRLPRESTKEDSGIRYYLYYDSVSVPFMDNLGYASAIENAKNFSRHAPNRNVVVRWSDEYGPHRMEFQKGSLLKEQHPL